MSKRQSNGTGTFKIRKDGTVEYKVSLGSGINGAPIRKSFYGKYKADAIAKYKEWLKESGNVPIEKVETVKEWAYLWLELYKKITSLMARITIIKCILIIILYRR